MRLTISRFTCYVVCTTLLLFTSLHCISEVSGEKQSTFIGLQHEPDAATKAMIDSVQLAQSAIDPMKVSVFMSNERAQFFLQKSNSAVILDRINYMVMYGFEELKSGNTQTAIDAFEKVLELADQIDIPGKEQTMLEMKRLLALSYLRLGEQENCILNHTAASCIIPIQKEGQHQKPDGSAEAMKLYREILSESPDDLTSRFLLNIAAMTLGKFPDGIPATQQLPKDYFSSKTDFPRFKDISTELGFTKRGLAGGVAVEDFDRDGDLDIMTSEWGFHDQLRFYINNGEGKFIDQTAAAGIEGVTGGLQITHTDYNNDGYPDLLILRGAWFQDQGAIPNSLLKNNGNGTFTDVTVQAGLYTKRPTQNAVWSDFDLDGHLDLFIGNESQPARGSAFNFPSQLYHNQGDGTFKEIATVSGLVVNTFVKGCTAGDINNDGLPDLYISVLQGSNRLFLNTSDADGIHFRDITAKAGVGEPFVSFPTWMFDYNNDGWQDIFVSAYSDGSEDLPGKLLRAYGKRDDPFRPRLYRNNGDMTFSDVSSSIGLTEPAFTMGCNYGDLDNDGFPDFLLGTGEPNLKSIIPNKMYLNNAGTAFEDITYAGGFGHLQKGHGVGFGDLDHDGDQDIYMVMGGSFEGDVYQDILYENPIGNKNHWIVLQLEGKHANRMAIGAKVRITIPEGQGVRHIYETVSTGSSFGGNSLQLEIGLGQAEMINEIEITWPSGKSQKQVFHQIAADKAYLLEEGNSFRELPYKAVPFQLDPHAHHH